MILTTLFKQKAFSLIELSVALVIIGILVALAITLIPKLNMTQKKNEFRVEMAEIDKAIDTYLKIHFRLPCPDINNTGRGYIVGGECRAATGDLPYLDLGYDAPIRDINKRKYRYVTYRGVGTTAANDADLARVPLINRYVPVLPPVDSDGIDDGTSVLDTYGINLNQATHINDLDLCRGLRNAQGKTLNVNYANVTHQEAVFFQTNIAYIIASGGLRDMDKDGADGFFDGLNENAGVAYDSPDKNMDATYDDLVHARSFSSITGQLSCAGLTIGVSSSSNIAIADYYQWRLAKSAHDNAVQAQGWATFTIVMAGVGTAIAAASALQAVGNGTLAAAQATAIGNPAPAVLSVAEGIAVGVEVAAAAAALVLAIAAQVEADIAEDTALVSEISARGARDDALILVNELDRRGGTTL